MFCPNCGIENQDDVAYCRSCGGDLKVISQAMKGHTSIALVSKLDAYIEKKDERLRRDAILVGFLGALLTVGALLGGFSWFGGDPLTALTMRIIFLILGPLVLWSALLKFLAFRRSLELRSLPLDQPEPSVDSHTGDDEVSDGLVEFCPKCGTRNSDSGSYCRACGLSLDLSIRPQGMERYLPSFLIKLADDVRAKNEVAVPTHKTSRALFLFIAVFLFQGFMAILNENWISAGFFLLLGSISIVAGIWDLIAYQRAKPNESGVGNDGPDPPTGVVYDLINNWGASRRFLAALFAIMLVFLGLVYFGIAPLVSTSLLFIVGAFGFLAILGTYLKGRETRHLESLRGRLEENSVTKELPPADASPVPSILTEATTSRFDAVPAKVNREEATRKLDDHPSADE